MIETTMNTSLNLCLGLRNKKDAVKRLIQENEIDIMCLQETEIPVDFPIDLLTFKGYNYENEFNQIKSRCGIYVSNKTTYNRRTDLEIVNMHVMIIDVNDSNNTRIINVYRPFNPVNGLSQKDFFEAQLALIKENTNANTIIMGYFNLDQSKIFELSYSHKNYFISLNEVLSALTLIQAVKCVTWSRVINNVLCTSIIDHVYLKDPTLIKSIYPISPPFGDHSLILIELNLKHGPKPILFKRNWVNYTQDKLKIALQKTNWHSNLDSVQAYWNNFESNLVEIVDDLAPFERVSETKNFTINPPKHIKNKINKRNRLLKKTKIKP